MSAIEPISVTVRTAMAMTSLSKTRVYDLVREGKLSTYQIGRTRLIDVKSLREFMAGHAAPIPPRKPALRPKRRAAQ